MYIRNASIIEPGSPRHQTVADVLVDNGIIKKIGSFAAPKNATVVAGEGLCISPGWVDILADYCEPGYEQKETITTGLAAAASGGYTQVLLAPGTSPVLDSKAGISYVLGRAAGNIVGLHPVGCATRNGEGKELAEMLDMRANGAVAFSDGWKPVQNAGLVLKTLEYLKAFDGLLIQLPVDASLAAGGLMNEGETSTQLGMAGIPALAETLMVHREIELVRYTGSRLHLTGITTAASVAMVRSAKQDGLQVTCSATPYHLVLNDTMLRGYSSDYKVSPPLRSEADRLALVAGLADGTIDCIASHHRPHEWDAKTKEYEYAANGMAIQELTFSVLWNTLQNEVPLERLIDALAIRPAVIFGLAKATIEAGSAASLTVFSTVQSSLLPVGKGASQGQNNPFAGKQLVGKVVGIINNNQLHLNK